MKKVFLITILTLIMSMATVFTGCNPDTNSSSESSETSEFVLSSISITTNPTKTDYLVGEQLDLSGMIVSATFNNGSEDKTEDVTDDISCATETIELIDDSIEISYENNGVTKTASFDINVKLDAEKIDTLEESDVKIIKDTTESRWLFTYGETSLDVLVYVLDTQIVDSSSFYSNDGISLILTSNERVDGIKNGTVLIDVSANGESKIKINNDNVFSAYEDNGITASATKFTLDDTKVDGYYVSLSIPYDKTNGITKVDKNACMYFGLNVAGGGDVSLTNFSQFDSVYEKQHTYSALTDDNTLIKNPYFNLGHTFGDAGVLLASNVWDITHDDGTENAYIKTTAVDFNNQAIYFHEMNSANLFAQVDIALDEVRNGEQFGKLGLIVKNQVGDGLFFYIDAYAENGKDVIGTGLGYAKIDDHNVYGYTGVKNNVNASEYTNGNKVTLSIYREDNMFVLYCKGEEVGKVGGIDGIENDTVANVGLMSYNIMFTASNYSIVNDADTLANYKIVAEDVDTLFIGDSYVDRAFWYDFDTALNGASAVNLGVGGTKVEYWIDYTSPLEKLYNFDNIVMHIGVNDINGFETVDDTTQRINTLFDKILEINSDANIYYVSINPNNFTAFNNNPVDNYAKYKQVNEYVSNLAIDDSNLTFINLADVIGSEAGSSVAHYYLPDGLHLNGEGYALWNREIKSALGLEVRIDNELGDSQDFAYSQGWSQQDGYVENTAQGESKIYFTDIKHTDFYAQVDVSVVGRTAPDQFAKLGLAITSNTKTVFYYIDALTSDANATNFDCLWGNIVTRVHGEDWQWANQAYPATRYLRSVSYNNNFKSIAIVKKGNALYALSDGHVIMYLKDAFTADENVSVSLMGFNLQIQAKNAEAITEETAFDAKMAELNIGENSNKVINGNLSDWTEDQLSQSFEIVATEGRGAEVFAYMETDGVYIAVKSLQNTYINNRFDGWFNNTNIEFHLGNAGQRFVTERELSRWEDGGSRDVGASKMLYSVTEDLKASVITEIFVPYSMIEGYNYDSAYIPSGFAIKTPGEQIGQDMSRGKENDYWYMAEGAPVDRNLQITKNGLGYASCKTIDGDISDWSETDKSNTRSVAINVHGGTAEFNAVLAEDGVYLFAKFASASIADNKNMPEWWRNTNLEVKVNGSHSRVMLFNENIYHTGKMANAKYVLTKNADDLDILTIEMFIPYATFGGSNATESVELELGGVINNGESNEWTSYVWDGNKLIVTKQGIQ